MFDSRDVGTHLDAAREQLRAERRAMAAKVLAAGRFALARMAQLGHAFDDLIVDDWELAAAELGAELGISRGRACTLITQGRDLLTRLPAFAEVFATGTVDLRVLRLILTRTALIVDPDIIAVIDTQLAGKTPSWNTLSDERIADLIDWMIVDVDPEAVRRARNARRRRHLSIDPVGNGMLEVYGLLDAGKGAVLDQQLDALARTVCPHDPRTHAQRRADAVDALQAGSMACLCGREDCPATGNAVPTGQYVIHVIAGQDSIDAAGRTVVAQSRGPAEETAAPTPPAAPTPAAEDDPAPVDVGEPGPDADPVEPVAPAASAAPPADAVAFEVDAAGPPSPAPFSTSPRPALIPGYGPITADQLHDLLPYATIRPVTDAAELGTEHGYHPSRALTEFVGCRDLICRWPGCTIAAQRCDVDHTTPWPYGPTHPSNTKLYCRIHHLIKTFHCGPDGWTDRQHPDGTITLTAPNGRTYTTTPGGLLFFPQLGIATAELPTVDMPPPNPHRNLAAPKRSRTRAQNRAYRIAHERALNRAHIEADPPPV